MEVFNVGPGVESVEKQTYGVIKDRVGLSEEEFMKLSANERNEWVDACRLTLLLWDTKKEELHEGYQTTDMYTDDGTFDLGAAVEIVRNKKRALDVVEKYTDIDLTPAQFVLMGDVGTHALVNEAMKQMNLDTAKALETPGVSNDIYRAEAEQIAIDRARRTNEEFNRMFGESNTSGEAKSDVSKVM